jgi:hypothetical protein
MEDKDLKYTNCKICGKKIILRNKYTLYCGNTCRSTGYRLERRRLKMEKFNKRDLFGFPVAAE